MVSQHVKRSWKSIMLLSLLAVILLLLILPMNTLHLKMNSFMVTIKKSFSIENEVKLSCINVTDNMVLGSWKQDKLNQSEMTAVLNFHKKIREYHGIPMNLQHKDNLCGNINLQGISTRGITIFRALCDPNGSTPCCFENKCVLKTVEECKCKNCYDIRQKLHAEVSKWIPSDPTCKVTTFSGEKDSCKVLRDMTIYFIGDSHIRQLYIALLSIIRNNKPSGLLTNQTPAVTENAVDWGVVITDVIEQALEEMTRLQTFQFWKASQINDIFLKYIRELQGKPNSLVIISVGLHFRFNMSVIEKQVLNPLLLNLTKSPWPKLLWLSAQAPGLLKSPSYFYQQRKYTVQYNLIANDFMSKKGIPILDFFQMTEPVMSYDGTHHGMGVNKLKAQVLLNYILEMRTRG